MADEPRPPFVIFETRTEEDREATIEAGHYVGKDVIYAKVTPVGSRDCVEKKLEDWLANLEEGVRQERIPSFWLDAYRRAADAFINSREDPENGTPIKDWPSASPSQIKTMLDVNIRTVEDLAAANDEALGRVGMGGRALKEKAIAWLASANDQGKLAEEVTKVREQNKALTEQNKSLTERVKKLEEAVKKEDA